MEIAERFDPDITSLAPLRAYSLAAVEQAVADAAREREQLRAAVGEARARVRAARELLAARAELRAVEQNGLGTIGLGPPADVVPADEAEALIVGLRNELGTLAAELDRTVHEAEDLEAQVGARRTIPEPGTWRPEPDRAPEALVEHRSSRPEPDVEVHDPVESPVTWIDQVLEVLEVERATDAIAAVAELVDVPAGPRSVEDAVDEERAEPDVDGAAVPGSRDAATPGPLGGLGGTEDDAESGFARFWNFDADGSASPRTAASTARVAGWMPSGIAAPMLALVSLIALAAALIG